MGKKAKQIGPIGPGYRLSDFVPSALLSRSSHEVNAESDLINRLAHDLTNPTPFAPPSTSAIKQEEIFLIPDDKLEKSYLEKDLMAFVRASWHVIEPSSAFEPGIHTEAICLHLQAVCETWATLTQSLTSSLSTTSHDGAICSIVQTAQQLIRDLAISVPPRHGKSIISSVIFPAWVWTRFPEARFMNIAYAHSLTIAASVLCRQLIESAWYQERWGAMFRLTGDQNTKIRFNNSKGGFRISTSINGTITGAGADFIIADDLNDINKIHSPGDRLKVKTKWKKVISTRLNDPRTGCHIVIAQRGHCDDLIGNLGPDYTHLDLPAKFIVHERCITPIWSDPRTDPDELLNPVRFPIEELEKLFTELGPYDFAAQFQQRPVSADGGIFNTEWFQFFTPSQRPDYTTATMSCISVDMNFGSTSPGGSYVVAQVWARFLNLYYLLDQIRGQWEYVEAKRQIRALWEKWPRIYCVAVEDKANGPALLSDLKLEIPGLLPITPKGSKEARARSVSGIAASKMIYIPHPDYRIYPDNAWVGRFFLPEVGTFPKAENDDQVDAMSQGINKIRQVVAHCSDGSEGEDGDGDDEDQDTSLGNSLSSAGLTGRGSLGMGMSRFQMTGRDEDDEGFEEFRGGKRAGRGGLFGGRR